MRPTVPDRRSAELQLGPAGRRGVEDVERSALVVQLTRALCLAALLSACSGGSSPPHSVDTGWTPTDTVTPGPDIHTDPPHEWSNRVVSTESLTGPLRAGVTPEGRLVAAALRHTGTVPGCTLEVAGTAGPVQSYEAVVLTEDDAEDDWHAETAASLDGGFGLGLTVLPTGAGARAGEPVVAYMGGTPGEEFCGGSDLVVQSREADGDWRETFVQTDSAVPGVTCGAMQDVCNTGDVTGMWPALAAVPSDPGTNPTVRLVVAFRDVHFGYTKEDYDSSDLEIAVHDLDPDQPLPPRHWTTYTVDDSSGAGRGSAIAHDPTTGAIYVAYANPKTGTLHLASFEEDAWTTEEVAQGDLTTDAPALVVEPDGTPGVVAWNGALDSPWYFRRAEGGIWQREPIDTDGRGGRQPSVAVSPAGDVQVAYRHCDRAGTTGDCSPARDGLRLATRDADGRWSVETLPADEEMSDGLWPALVYAPGAAPGDPPRILSLSQRWDPATAATHTALVLSE